jgi:hypothetical protein
MNSEKSFQKTTGILAILAGILALVSLVVGLAGVDYDFEVFSDTSSLIAAGADAAVFIRWSYWLNMVGNYLFLMPLTLLLYQWRKADSPGFAQMYTGSGLIYMLLGAAGSAILAEAWPFLMEQYELATAAQFDFLITDFQVVNAIAESGLHGVLQNFCGAVWFLGMGSLIQKELRPIGIFTLIVGLFLLLNTLGNLFNIEALSLLGLTANILFAPIWSIWIGVYFLKNKGVS